MGADGRGEVAYSVNFDPDEADPAKIERQQLEKLLGGAPVVFADNPNDLSSVFALLREGKGLWGGFLAAVLIALVFETFISNRLQSPTPTTGNYPAASLRSTVCRMPPLR